MELLKAAVFGILQGLTEFLPVSSSGHLALFDKLFAFTPEGGFRFSAVSVHAATLLSVVIVFRRDILSLFGANRRLIPLLVAGTFPAGVFGLLSGDFFEHASSNMVLVGLGFMTSALFLLVGRRHGSGVKHIGNLSLLDSIAVGFAQALAILPGVSRSGSTISLAQYRGVENASAARFSFLLMIPAVGGAMLLDLREVISTGTDLKPIPITISFATALLTGIFALKLLLGLLRRGSFSYFCCYLLPLGVATILYGLLG